MSEKCQSAFFIATPIKEQLNTISFEAKLDIINQLQKLNTLLMLATCLSPRAQYAHFVIVLKWDRHCSYNVTLWCVHITFVAVEMHSVCWDARYCQLYNSIKSFTAMLLWQIYVAGKNKTYVHFHVKCAHARTHTLWQMKLVIFFYSLCRLVTSQM